MDKLRISQFRTEPVYSHSNSQARWNSNESTCPVSVVFCFFNVSLITDTEQEELDLV